MLDYVRNRFKNPALEDTHCDYRVKNPSCCGIPEMLVGQSGSAACGCHYDDMQTN